MKDFIPQVHSPPVCEKHAKVEGNVIAKYIVQLLRTEQLVECLSIHATSV